MKNNILKKALFLVTLLTLMIFSNGQYSSFFVIWISTSMLLFGVRKLNRWQGYIFALVAIAISYYIGFDVVPFLPVTVSVVIALIYSSLAAIPYLVDSFFSKKRNSFLSTLIFPTAAVIVEYAYCQFNLYGTWGHMAYTQQSQLSLIQSVSVFGLGYITFLITWFAAVCNWVHEQKNEWSNVKRGVIAYVLVLATTLIFGVQRIHFKKSNTSTVKIASISSLDSLNFMIDIQGLNNNEVKNDIKAVTQKNTNRLNQYLFNRSIAEAQAGAKIVFWAEGNGIILKEDENKLYEKASKIAIDQQIYLGLGLAIIDPSNAKFLENKFVMFNKKGKMVIDYWKGISVPGAEEPISNNKSTPIPKIATEYGTISSAICFDLDFPNFLKQTKGADILLSPSNDYKEIDPLHTDMTKYRAIEQGFNFIRQTSHGLSIGTNYTGKVISKMDHFDENNKTMITQLPTKGTKTIYATIGDSFIVICLLILIFVSIVLNSKKNAQ